MKKLVVVLLASMALFACKQNGQGENGQAGGQTESGAAGVTPAPGTGDAQQSSPEGEPNVVDTAAQDTANDASLKPAPRNETTPPDISKPKQ